MNLKESILNLFISPTSQFSQAELLRELELPKSLKRRLSDVLEELCREGSLKETAGHRYALARKSGGGRSLVGRISLSARGSGFVRVQGQPADLFVPPSMLGWALPGDQVEVRLLPPRRGERDPKDKQAAEVVRVVERGRKQWVGRLGGEAGGREVWLTAKEGELQLEIPLTQAPKGAAMGDWVVAEAPPADPASAEEAKGKPISVLGGDDTPGLDTLILIKKAGLREEFPDAVLAAAEAIPASVAASDIEGRLDLRRQVVFTIDGADAKDFDDAVSIENLVGGGYRLGVHIADVGHYVTPGSLLDQEAYARGTSTYLPDRVLPMLPEPLSNGLCSLKEGVDRLTMSAIMDFNAEGRMESAKFADSVIHSSKRFTYEEVQQVLDHRDLPHGHLAPALVDTLLIMQGLAHKLIKRRHERGALDFDFPETKVEVDAKGEVQRLYRRGRLFAHRLIEEFMLSANEAVAHELGRREVPVLYRIHEEPDPEKLADTLTVLARFKLGAPPGRPVKPKAIQHLLERAVGRPEERLVNTLILRSLRLARYSPDNAGHFGLALEEYCHFTSPIRRYPDLVVHRMLRRAVTSGQHWTGQDAKAIHGRLVGEGEICSSNERKSESCERECVKAKQIRYLQKRLGETFASTITSVTTFGFFAEIDEFPAEGLVHVRTLSDDHYEFDRRSHRLVGERKGKVFNIGDKITVKVVRTDWEALQVDFALV